MKPIERSEIVDYKTYEEVRDAFRRDVMAQKADRRIRVGEYLTFLFENRMTVRYQIQEMIRIERIVREAEIRHEIDTYNELLGGPGGLGCTLLIEVEDEGERDVRLREWIGLPKHLYLRLEDGRRVPAAYDERQGDGDRLSSVQYLRFDTGGEVPVAVGTDFGPLECEVELTPAQRAALERDLAE